MRTPSTPATAALDALGIAWIPRPFVHRTGAASYGLEAAAALGTAPDRVLKTLVIDCGGRFATAVLAVDAVLDLRAAAGALGAKHAVLADPAVAERRTGYVVGGISPLGQRTPGPVVVDEGALDHGSVLVSGGRRGFDVELAPTDLVAATGATVARVRR